jgi:hypothetical protein
MKLVLRVAPFVIAGVLAVATVMAQPQGPAAGRADNVRAVVRDVVVNVTYDLVADDPRATFAVRLEASRDGGKTYDIVPKSVTGHVGAGVMAGAGKSIFWRAGEDIESVGLERFQYRVVLTREAMPVAPAAAKPAVSPPPAPAAPAAPPASAPAAAKGGGSKLKWILPLVGGGAAAGIFAARGSGDDGGTGTGGDSNLNATISSGPINGTVAALAPGQNVSLTDHVLGTAPSTGQLSATLRWTPSQAIILRLVVLVDGVDAASTPVSCSFVNAPDCATVSNVTVSSVIRPGGRVTLRVINFGSVAVNYSLTVSFLG